ncbi:MAG: hypothetical protein ACE5ET_08140 [Gammaproteobacteria bacterium]
MSITAINNHLPVPRGVRPATDARQGASAVQGVAASARRGVPVERVIEGEVVDKPAGGTRYSDPFSRTRSQWTSEGGSGLHAMLGIAAYLANSVEPRSSGASRYVDYYV